MALRSLLVLSSMWVFGWCSLLLGKDICWDLANYHYYNAFAFLHARKEWDSFPPSFIHQYLNPLLDLVNYFLIQFFTPSKVAFILGALHGLNVFLLFLISRIFLPTRFVLPLLIALFGMCDPLILNALGSLQNDNSLSLLLLGGLYCFLTSMQAQVNFHRLFSAAILVGMAVGLKYTLGIYIFGMLIAALIFPMAWSRKARILLLLNLGFLTGVLLTDGYFMGQRFLAHGNPVFPFFNGLFHSPDFPAINFQDKRFLPKTIWQALFFPFFFSVQGGIAEFFYSDMRMLLSYLLVMAAIIKLIFMVRKKNVKLQQPAIFLLMVFFISSFMVWEWTVSIARYMIILEMLAPLIIFLLIQFLIDNKRLSVSLFLCCMAFILLTMQFRPLSRFPLQSNHYFNTTLPGTLTTTKKTVVLIAFPAFAFNLEPRPQNYLIAFFPPAWRFIGVPYLNEKYAQDLDTRKIENEHLIAAAEQIFLLSSDYAIPDFIAAAKLYHLNPTGACEKIFSDRQKISSKAVLLCEMRKGVTEIPMLIGVR